jgi:heme-degrading monooxygenase HmoA
MAILRETARSLKAFPGKVEANVARGWVPRAFFGAVHRAAIPMPRASGIALGEWLSYRREERCGMWARVSKFEGPAEQLESGARETLRDMAQRIPGSKGAFYLVDRENDRSMAVTLWESEDALRESEGEADRIRTESAQRGEGRIGSVERYEVTVEPSDVT